MSVNDNIRYWVATAPVGAASVLAEELAQFGAEQIRERSHDVKFQGTLEVGYRACLWSRTATRVFLSLGSIEATSAKSVYEGVKRMDWREHIAPGATLACDCSGGNESIRHTIYGSQLLKDAVCDSLRESTGERPNIRPEQPDVLLHLHVEGAIALVSLDFSGESLHRRGYRSEGGRAPLKENVAAAVLLRAGWREIARQGGTLLDPMCGSGTFLTEGALIAAMFAAQGYIVVAPNYAGYDISTLAYHPYLNADQQSKDMMDALTAARTALPHSMTTSTTDGGKLFITGYSQGGHVAMATHRAMQAAGLTVTASAPMSGPYALEAFGDAVFYGQVNIGSTIFTPLLVSSYQNAYGNIYKALTDVYEPNYAPNMANLLPSLTPLATLFANGTLPESALFNSTPPETGNATLDGYLAVPSNPVFAAGFGTSNLVTNNFRLAYVLDAVANPDGAVPTPTAGVPVATNPQNTLRIAFKTNDLRNWTPHAPVLMCGGDQDPTVFFSVNTLVMQQYWAQLPAGLITVADINAPVTGASDPFAAAKVGYQTTIASIAATQGQSAAVQAIHATEAPFCTAVARGFFAEF